FPYTTLFRSTAMTDSFAELRGRGEIAKPGSAGQPLQFTRNATSAEATRRGWATQPVESTGCPSGAKRVDLAIMSIGAYNPWIHSHCTPEQAIDMANAAGARFIMPVHHQTFRLSFEPFREPIERFVAALGNTPERIALREIGETFVLPLSPRLCETRGARRKHLLVELHAARVVPTPRAVKRLQQAACVKR